ncbi:hypothetical protein F5X99DRAFT_414407 [Biscogniauxia marginata]|nr:hypothetical protein F5X99DRAFT_414407 [Biscogniauxia marginata]
MSGEGTSTAPKPVNEWFRYKPLNLEEMRKQPLEDTNDREEYFSSRQRMITERCNYWYLRNTDIRGRTAPYGSREPTEFHESNSQPYPLELLLPKDWCQDFNGGLLPLPSDDQEQKLPIPANKTREVLEVAMDHWRKGGERAVMLREAIDSIEKPERVTKIVCLGLGAIFHVKNQELYVHCDSLAQHTAARAIAEQLRHKTGKMVELYASDLAYNTDNYKEALSTLPGVSFTILDPSFGKHEQFNMIDDSMILFGTGFQCPTLLIVNEIARPLAMITESVRVNMSHQWDLTVPDGELDWSKITEVNDPEDELEDELETLEIPGCCTQTHPKRDLDMLENEYDYDLCEKFPLETAVPTRPFDLLPLDDWKLFSGGLLSGNAIYWNWLVRMYIRKA